MSSVRFTSRQYSVVPTRGCSWTPRGSSNLRPLSEPNSGSPVSGFSTSSSLMLRVSTGAPSAGRLPGRLVGKLLGPRRVDGPPGGRVLVVDDEPNVASFVGPVLRGRGFAVDVPSAASAGWRPRSTAGTR